MPSLAPIRDMTSLSGSSFTPNRRSYHEATDSLNSGSPSDSGYLWLGGSKEASWRPSRTCCGVGMSGSPMPKLMTLMPWAFFSAIFRLICTNKYGGTAFTLAAVFNV